MFLTRLALQHFRSYSEAIFPFTDKATIIIGPNAAGKSNVIESLVLLTTGKSFRSEKEGQLVQFGQDICRITGELHDGDSDETKLEIVLSHLPGSTGRKKYLVNGIPRRRVDFVGRMPSVLFTPEDLDLVTGQPGNRRRFLDDTLSQTDDQYHVAHTTYTKALRQRNALLEQVQQTGIRNEKIFTYWDELLITNGSLLTAKRQALIDQINARLKELFSFTLSYDASIISEERLARYKAGEVGAGVTLVGPHRDDVLISGIHPVSKEPVDLKYFASRGQQRLVTLELKLAQIAFVEEQTKMQPLLLLDDIFSELDSGHIAHVLQFIHTHQTIITTTHREFVENVNGNVIELENNPKSNEY